MKLKKISLIILLDQLSVDIDRLIDSINRQSLDRDDYEVLLASSDYRKAAILQEQKIAFDARWIPISKNLNLSESKNFTANLTRSEIVVFINEGVILDSELLASHLNFHLNNKSQPTALGENIVNKKSDNAISHFLIKLKKDFLGYNYYLYGSMSVKKIFLINNIAWSREYIYLSDFELMLRLLGPKLKISIIEEAKTIYLKNVEINEVANNNIGIGEEVARLVCNYPYESSAFINKLDYRWPNDIEYINSQLSSIVSMISSLSLLSLNQLESKILNLSSGQINAYDCLQNLLEQYLKYCRIIGMSKVAEVDESFPIAKRSLVKNNKNLYVYVENIPDFVEDDRSRSFWSLLGKLIEEGYSISLICSKFYMPDDIKLLYLERIGVTIYLDIKNYEPILYANQGLDLFKIFSEKPPFAILFLEESEESGFLTEARKFSKSLNIYTNSNEEKFSTEGILSYLNNKERYDKSKPDSRISQLNSTRFRKKVSIVIPVFNKVEFTKKCLETLYKTLPNTDNYEVVVVNNGSTDSSQELLMSYSRRYDNFFKLDFNMNLGFSRSINKGVEFSSGEYLVFLNNDTELLDNWLDELIKPLESDFEIGAVGAKLLYPNFKIQHAGVVFVRLCNANFPLAPYHLHRESDDILGFVNQPMIYPAVTAACLAMRRLDFEMVKGLDESYWNGYEDIDLCFKLSERNLKILYQPKSRLIHYEGQSGTERRNKEDLNRDLFFKKWKSKVIANYLIDPVGSLRSLNLSNIYPYEPLLIRSFANSQCSAFDVLAPSNFSPSAAARTII